MLLSIEVSLYCPRFVVMDAENGKIKIIFTAMNNHLRETSMAQRNRTPVGNLLMEIAEKLEFILTAYPVTNAVWCMRQFGIANLDAARTALGAILLILAQHGIVADEMLRSRMQLYLTGTSKPDVRKLNASTAEIMSSCPETYEMSVRLGLAWLKAQQLID